MLSRDEILKSQDIKCKEVEVPEWGGSVYIKELSRGQQDAYMKRLYGNATTKSRAGNSASDADTETQMIMSNMFGHEAWLCAQAICDADGKVLFTQADVKALNNKNSKVIGDLAAEILEYSGIGAEITQINEELKNSREAQS